MRQETVPCVYILASKQFGTLYIGVTSDICARVSAHRQKLIPGFTRKYGASMLVYYEFHGTMEDAITREKQLKEWQRVWKIQLIESDNPRWLDRFVELCGPTTFPSERKTPAS